MHNRSNRFQIIKFIFVGIVILTSSSFSDELWRKLSKKKKPTFFQIQKAAIDFYGSLKSKYKPGFKQYKRWENFARQRLDKDGYFNMSLNYRGWLEKKSRFRKGERISNESDWKPIGPYSSSNISGLGRLNCITFDPFNQDIIWVGAPTGGLWKSIDAGQNWSTNTDQLPNLGVSDIVIHPKNPNIMYIATGDKQRGSALSFGVMKSIDGGKTWQFTGLNPELTEKYKIGKLMIHPDNPDTLLCVTNFGVYKTIDGGVSWILKEEGDFFDLEVHPNNSGQWYASHSKKGVYRTLDSGETWTRLSNGLPLPGDDIGRIAIAVSLSDPNTIYALYCQDRIGEGWIWGFYGLYCSTDGGNNWILKSSSPNILGWDTRGYDTGGQGGYALVLQVNPENPDIVIAGSVNLWKSIDGGVNWSGASFNNNQTIVHPDFHELAYLPGSGNVLYACHDGGLHRSDNDGETWTDISSGLGIHQVYRIGLFKQNSNKFLIGAQDNGSSLLDTNWSIVGGGDGMEGMIDPINSNNIYSSSQFGNISLSTNNGVSRSRVFADTHGVFAWIAPLIMDPFSPNTVYTASTFVFKSTDQGRRSSAISPQLTTDPIRILKIAPNDSNVFVASDGKSIFKTDNGGETWSELNNQFFINYITDIAIHPKDSNILWVSVGGYGRWNSHFTWLNISYEIDKPKIFFSRNGGIDWIDVSGKLPNIPANCIAVDPASLGVYLGTDLGVFYSASGLGDWSRFDNGLPNIIVTEMEIHQASNQIFAATYGRGVWFSPLAENRGLFPPLFFSGNLYSNRSLLNIEYVVKFTWKENQKNTDNTGKNSVVSYCLYEIKDKKQILLAEIDTNTFEYILRDFDARKTITVFGLTVKNADGDESNPVYFSIQP